MSLIGQGLSVGFPKIQSCKNQIDRFRTKFGMTNFKKLCAFTLSELLLSLTIVGVIAVITVPVIVGNIQKQIFATKLKNTVTMIEQVAQQELIRHHTRDLRNTDFADPEKLLSDKHFSIVKICPAPTAGRDCWKTSATVKDKITYKTLQNSNFSVGFSGVKAIVLKNGAILVFSKGNKVEQSYRGGIAGYFYIDVNGNEKPNIVGRDLFLLWLTKEGKIVGYAYIIEKAKTLSQLNYLCKNSPSYTIYYCYDALVANNWKMDY